VTRHGRPALVAGATVLALALSACGGSGAEGGGGAATTSPAEFSYLTNTENTTVKTVLTTLSTGACKTQNDALPLKVDTVPQTNLDQKLQLLAGQNGLPVQFAAGNSPALTTQLFTSGQVADLEAKLSELGVLDKIEPAAVSTIKAQYGGKLLALPYEYNIEGIFYNKKLFAAQGVTEPGTWDELVAAAATFQAAGVQPFAASGQQGWPITRLIGNYLFRKLGPDALKDVADGKAKLTDPQYVEAAQQVADLGAKGYFGKGVGSVDYDGAFNAFLTGKAAMFYMGSWALADIGNAQKNKIGADNVGFMPFPAVTGGAGGIDQYPSNVGLPMTLSAKTFDGKVGDWVTCIAENYGSTAFSGQGSISGFKPTTDVPAKNAVTTQVRDTIAKSTRNVLWFEGLFDAKATTVSQTNAAPLVTGGKSAQDFMTLVQSAIGS
jgi:raffinose/stachyose/melibiose transport system substrate-binding protein